MAANVSQTITMSPTTRAVSRSLQEETTPLKRYVCTQNVKKYLPQEIIRKCHFSIAKLNVREHTFSVNSRNISDAKSKDSTVYGPPSQKITHIVGYTQNVTTACPYTQQFVPAQNYCNRHLTSAKLKVHEYTSLANSRN